MASQVRNPKNAGNGLFRRLTRLFSGPIVNHRKQAERSFRRNKLVRYDFQSASGQQFKRSNYNPLENLQSEILANQLRFERYADFEAMEFCLHGDTKIATPEGYETIKELSQKYGLEDTFIVYSYDHEKNQIVPAYARQARKTRTDHAWKVTFENGQYIIGTSDHRLMLRDSSYKKICDLKSGDSMMPFYRKDFYKTKKDAGDGYRWIYTVGNGWVAEHKIIAEWLYNRKVNSNPEIEEVVHHKNFIKYDNRSENLDLMEKKEHTYYHPTLYQKNNKNTKKYKELQKRHSRWMKANNPAVRKDITFEIILQLCDTFGFSEKMLCEKLQTDPQTIVGRLKTKGFKNFVMFAKTYCPDWQNAGCDNRGEKNPRYDKTLTFQKICDIYRTGISLQEILEKLNTTYAKFSKRLKENGYRNFTDWSHNFANHKVAKVEYYGFIDLYDLTVDKYKNFATDTVISHNTPEISSVLDIVSDEMTTSSSLQPLLTIFCSNEEIKDVLNTLYHKILNIEFNLFGWCRSMCKYGDHFLYLDIDETTGVKNAVSLPVAEIERLEGEDKTNPNYIQYQWNVGGITFENWQIAHFRILGNDKYAPYGSSYLDAARRIFRQLEMLENAVMAYRIVRCLHEDSKVWTEDGYKKIKYIEVGDRVYSYNKEKAEYELGSVTNVINNGKQQIWEIKSLHRTLKTNFNHPILVKDKKTGIVDYVLTKDLIPYQHQVCIPSLERENKKTLISLKEEKYEWFACLAKEGYEYFKTLPRKKSIRGISRDLEKLVGVKWHRIRHFLYFSSVGKKAGLPLKQAEFICKKLSIPDKFLIKYPRDMYNITEVNLPKYVDEEFARFFGFLVGDGWLVKNLNRVGFATGVYKEINDFYANIFKKYFSDVKFCQEKRGSNKLLGSYYVNSSYFSNLISDMGLTTSVYTKRIPSWVFTSENKIKEAFIEGLMDADGHRRKMKNVFSMEISLCNLPLVEDLKELVHQLGWNVSAKIAINKRKPRYIAGSKKETQSTTSYGLYITKEKSKEFENIVSVVKTEKYADVYDITVNNEFQNFVADGCIVHNSPERRVFYIDVGGIAVNDVEQYMQQVMTQMKRNSVVDSSTGQVNLRYNPLPVSYLTKIPLLNGEIITIEELSKRYESGEEQWVYSIQDETKKLVPGKVIWCGKNYEAKKMVKVWLDDNSYVETAPEHPYILRTGEQKRADELKLGDKLMPFYTRIKNTKTLKNYEQVYDPSTMKYEYTHRTVARNIYEEKFNNINAPTVHHIKCFEGEKNKQLIELVKANNNTKREIKNILHRHRSRFWIQDFGYDDYFDFLVSVNKKLKINTGGARKKKSQYKNHFITKIEEIEYPNGHDVYCMTVVGSNGEEDRHNFAVVSDREDGLSRKCGIFLKNSLEEDYYIPVRGNSASKIDTLPGGQYTGDIEDIKYLRDKLFSALKIPQSYLSRGEGADEDKTTLAQKDIRFARTVQRLQRSVVAELEKIGIIHLYILGYRGEDLLSFKLSLNNPSKIAELQEMEQWRTKFDVAGSATEGFFSRYWIAKKLFGMSDEEFLKNQREMFYDRWLDSQLSSVEEGEGGMGDMGGGLGDALGSEEDLSSDIEGGAEEEPADEEEPGDETLLAAPGNRDGKPYLTPKAKGKTYTKVKSDKRDMGARKRNYKSSYGEQSASSSKRNTFKGYSELSGLSRGLFESKNFACFEQKLEEVCSRMFQNKVIEEKETNYLKEEEKISQQNYDVKVLLEELENIGNKKKSVDKSAEEIEKEVQEVLTAGITED